MKGRIYIAISLIALLAAVAHTQSAVSGISIAFNGVSGTCDVPTAGKIVFCVGTSPIDAKISVNGAAFVSLKGTNGTNGTNGAPGATGATGKQGADGLPGATGPAGPAGPAGAPGKDGTGQSCSGYSAFKINSVNADGSWDVTVSGCKP